MPKQDLRVAVEQARKALIAERGEPKEPPGLHSPLCDWCLAPYQFPNEKCSRLWFARRDKGEPLTCYVFTPPQTVRCEICDDPDSPVGSYYGFPVAGHLVCVKCYHRYLAQGMRALFQGDLVSVGDEIRRLEREIEKLEVAASFTRQAIREVEQSDQDKRA